MATPQLYYKNGNSWQSAMLNSYPVGAIYSSTSSTNPGSIFGGGWAEITGAVLRGNKQGGVYSDSDTHILSIQEMPKHAHSNYSGTVQQNQAVHRAVMTTGHVWSKEDWAQMNESGGGQAHTNKQRAFNVYMWRRTS